MVKEEFELFRTAWSRFASCELQTHWTFLFYFILFYFTSVGLKSSPNDVPVVLGDDVFFLFFFRVFCFCFRLLSLLLMLDVLILMLIVHFLSYSYFHSHFPSHSHYDYHNDYLYRYGYRYHS